MLDYVSMIRDLLPPTRSYQVREFIFVPGSGGDGLGRLTLKLQHRYGVHRAYDLDSYRLDIDETPEPGDHGGRAFWLENITDPDAEEVYRCVVGGLTPKCGCKASRCQVRDQDGELVCKHASALRHLIQQGII